MSAQYTNNFYYNWFIDGLPVYEDDGASFYLNNILLFVKWFIQNGHYVQFVINRRVDWPK